MPPSDPSNRSSNGSFRQLSKDFLLTQETIGIMDNANVNNLLCYPNEIQVVKKRGKIFFNRFN